MITEVRFEGDPPVPIWIDVSDPAEGELDGLRERYSLPDTLVADCLQPFHLPKHEQSGDLTFLFVRSYDSEAGECEASVQNVTKGVGVFLGNRFLISVHRGTPAFLGPILAKYGNADEPAYLLVAMLEILLGAVETYQAPLEEAEAQVHVFESSVLTDRRDTAHWDAVFRTQARLTIIKRMLWHTLNAVQKFVPRSDRNLPLCQDLRERIESLLFFTDNLLEDLRNLLAVQLSLAANDTNDVMRTLATASVFFMPLTFIVGVYGMNFQSIPELHWRYGYLFVWATCALITIGLYRWFRNKHWM